MSNFRYFKLAIGQFLMFCKFSESINTKQAPKTENSEIVSEIEKPDDCDATPLDTKETKGHGR